MSEDRSPTASRKERAVFTVSADPVGAYPCLGGDPGRWAAALEGGALKVRAGVAGHTTPVRFCHDRHIRIGERDSPGEQTWAREVSRDVLRVKEMPWTVLADTGMLAMRGPALTWIFRSLKSGGNHGQARVKDRPATEVAFSPRGDRLWLFHGDPKQPNAPRSWTGFEVPTGTPVGEGELPAMVGRLAWSRDGTRLALGTDDGWVRILASEDFRELAAFGIESSWAPAALALSPDGSLVATAARTGEVRLWRAEDGERAGDLTASLPWSEGETLFFLDGDTPVALTEGAVRRAGAPEASPARPSAPIRRYETAPSSAVVAPEAWPRLAAAGLAPRVCEHPGEWWEAQGRRGERDGTPVDEQTGLPLGVWRLADGAPMDLIPGEDGQPPAYLDRFPVTVGAFARFLEDGEVREPDDWSGQRAHPRRPVVFLDHSEAQAYAAWAGGTLPGEALWERAARGGDGRRYPWGAGEGGAVANYRGAGPGELTDVDAHPAGASPFGTCDLAGNAAEWCADGYPLDRLEDELRVNRIDPLGGELRVVKGGAFTEEWLHLRADGRWAVVETERLRWVGFRCAVVLG